MTYTLDRTGCILSQNEYDNKSEILDTYYTLARLLRIVSRYGYLPLQNSNKYLAINPAQAMAENGIQMWLAHCLLNNC
jgi:hypothetical protein